jgi:hypothetical protein
VSAPLILPSKDKVQSGNIRLVPEKPASVPAQAGLVGTKSDVRVWGILGFIAVGVILGLSVYSIVRYLL